MAFNWTCPHCGIAQAVVRAKTDEHLHAVNIDGQKEGQIGVELIAIGCSNNECAKTSLHITLGSLKAEKGRWAMSREGQVYFEQIVYPNGRAKPQPDYIPAPLREDYVEACLVRDLSPKASATLVRRCLQGMIRDFAGISKATLFAEIDALRKAVDERSAPETITHDHIDAIDAVRGIGNIGAHMEKDINVIVDVDPGEAQALIDLVEMLFSEWYVARHKRQERLAGIQAMAAEKKAELAAQKAAAAQLEDKSDPPPGS